MNIHPFKTLYPQQSLIASMDRFCEEAKEAYNHYHQSGLFSRYQKPALYILQIETTRRKHTGLVCLNEVDDFFAGKVKKHEKTLSEREQHQIDLLLRWDAVLKPVLLTYPHVEAIETWMTEYTHAHRPFLITRFEKDHQTHRVWAVTDLKDIQALQTLFAQHIKGTYIADGHHRTSTLATLHDQFSAQYPEHDFDHLFCAFFAAPQLDILDYNRVVEGVKQKGALQLMVHLSHYFVIESLAEARKPNEKHEMVLYLRKSWFSLRLKPEVLQAYNEHTVVLDATLLNTLVLEPFFHITDVRMDKRITYVEGSKGFKGILKNAGSGNDRAGFMLYPVDFEDMMRLADLGESLPPKSTYFSPRLRSGLLVQELRKTKE
jgi:uncharacterized protein (DUF1015 family)